MIKRNFIDRSKAWKDHIILEYCIPIWSAYLIKDIKLIEWGSETCYKASGRHWELELWWEKRRVRSDL